MPMISSPASCNIHMFVSLGYDFKQSRSSSNPFRPVAVMPMISSPASCNIDVSVSLGHDSSQSRVLVNAD